jgi:hypothetical protein
MVDLLKLTAMITILKVVTAALLVVKLNKILRVQRAQALMIQVFAYLPEKYILS